MKKTAGSYRCSAGESFDSIALAVYGDEKYAEELLLANGQYFGKLIFIGGETLTLPDVRTMTDADTGQQISAAPWKR